MSDIVIKNIEFPKEGTLTLVITSSGEVCRIPRKYDRNETVVITGSKAVELPPHGDLIDRRKLWKDTEGLGEYCYDRDFISLCDAISEAPTVVEATE